MHCKIKDKVKNVSVFSIIVFLILAAYSLCLLYMIFWAFMTSVKNYDDYLFDSAIAFPKTFD